MGFTESAFIFVLFPLGLGGYYLLHLLQRRFAVLRDLRLRDVFLCLFSLLFYSFFNLYYLTWILIMIGVTYAAGILLKKCTSKKPALIVSLVILIGILFYFKYSVFVLRGANTWFGTNFSAEDIIPPLGISFITFSSISYLMDVYRGDAPAGSPLDVAFYLTFFPKVISGPIVLWKDFADKLRRPRPSTDLFITGINRIAIGFFKKVVLADTLGAFVSETTANLNLGIDVGSAWVMVLLCYFQIYLDFAGYSDIAVGLAAVFGYEIDNNFSFPYTATSITEFWKRWHISLGRWFKEYLYIPLGGNRRSKARTLLNLLIVFLITGIWHGAGLLYILWGLLHGFCRVIEALLRDNKIYRRVPAFFRWLVTNFIVMIGWTAFFFTSFDGLKQFFGILFGTAVPDHPGLTIEYYCNLKLILAVVCALLGSYLFSIKRLRALPDRLRRNKVTFALSELVILAAFVLSLIFMINSAYTPFLYFGY